jgi:hypothetical protein
MGETMDRLDPMAGASAPVLRVSLRDRMTCLRQFDNGFIRLSEAGGSPVAVARLGLKEIALERDLDAGRARSAVLRQSREGNCSGVVVLRDGSEHCNPGVRTRWIGTRLPQVLPRVVSDDPSAVRGLVAQAAGLSIEEDHHDNRD